MSYPVVKQRFMETSCVQVQTKQTKFVRISLLCDASSDIHTIIIHRVILMTVSMTELLCT